MYDFSTFADGAWTRKGDSFPTFNPARPHEAVGTYRATSAEEAAGLVESASRTQRCWAAWPDFDRLSMLSRYLSALRAHGEDLARAITLEQGKPLGEARGEVGKSLDEFERMLSYAAQPQGMVHPRARDQVRSFTVRRPRGVIIGITPWNFPVLTPLRKIAPALAFGNAVILKPSELTPAAACLLAELSREILPDGLLQVALGPGTLGHALVTAPKVAGITFTGSVATGRAIARAASENLAEISLELGGKNAAVIHDPVRLEPCLDQLAAAAFLCAGQRCTAISRVIVRTELAEPVVDGLVKRARAAVLGDGLAPGVTMGPLVSQDHLGKVEALVRRSLDEGAKAATGAECVTLPGLEDGYFYSPTILTDGAPGPTGPNAEIFGPVVSVLTYQDFDEAMALLNSVDYGLTSALFSNDSRIIQRFIDASENGMIHINHGTVPESHMPFGGIKASGVGAYSVGPGAASFYTTEHSVYWGNG